MKNVLYLLRKTKLNIEYKLVLKLEHLKELPRDIKLSAQIKWGKINVQRLEQQLNNTLDGSFDSVCTMVEIRSARDRLRALMDGRYVGLVVQRDLPDALWDKADRIKKDAFEWEKALNLRLEKKTGAPLKL